MRDLKWSAAVLIMVLAGALAGGAAEAAEEWGIDFEKIVRFDAKVVDILCELSGDCPAQCGAGKRQLGLLREDGRLIMVAKNQDLFAGASADLIQFCGQTITADGLLIENPKAPMMVLQFKRLAPDGKWSRANWFSKAWGKANPGKNADAWYKHHKTVLETIKKYGVYGIPGLKKEEE